MLLTLLVAFLALVLFTYAASHSRDREQPLPPPAPPRAPGPTISPAVPTRPEQPTPPAQEGRFLLELHTHSGELIHPAWSRYIKRSERPADARTAALLDSETTGFSREDEMVEIGIILFCFDATSGDISGVLDVYSGMREPHSEINPRAAQVNGLTREMLLGKTLDHTRVEAILNEAEFIVAHNAPFDRRFVEKLFPCATTKPWLCSMTGIDWRSYGMRSRCLKDLFKAHGLRKGPQHRALEDAVDTLHILQMQSSPSSLRPYFADLVIPNSRGGIHIASTRRHPARKPERAHDRPTG
jgi:DNA polymerase-3 subunit epsilon